MSNAAGNSREQIEAYLEVLRRRLKGIDEQDVREIVAELRSHIFETATVDGELTKEGVAEALAALGGPEELAREYVTDNLLARVEVSRSPVRVLESLYRWASLSVTGFFVFLCALGGYVVGVALILCALLKPLHPKTAGLWSYQTSTGEIATSIRLGFGSPPAGGRELLGWWIIPCGLIGGCILVMLTSFLVLWYVRRYRKLRNGRTSQARRTAEG